MAPPWHRDPVVWLLAIIGAASCASVVFAGRYLPYQDWAGHVGLSAVLAFGDSTGADVYFTRSLVPTPYYLFYVSTAAFGQLMPVEVAAKLNLVLASFVASLGAARLAQASGRSPRLCGLAPLMLFGVSLGLGFASFVTGLPWLLHALADTEHLVTADPTRRAKTAARLTVFLCLCFLGHGLVFGFAVLMIGIRLAVHFLRRPDQRIIVGYAAGGIAVVALLAIPSVVRRLQHRYISPEFITPGGPALAGWASVSEHFKSLGADLLNRGGGPGHTVTMVMVVAFVAIVAGARKWQGRHPIRTESSGGGLPLYAATMTLMFAFGPTWIGWPVTFWVVYQRAGTLAAMLLALLPTTNLRGWPGAALAMLAAVPVVHNALINRPLIVRYSEWAAPYDEIRRQIPPGQRVLGLNQGVPRRPGDTLYFYHLVDGAAYVPVGNIPEEVPVHRRNVPGTPYNPSTKGFDPSGNGRMYDYVVVYGHRPQRTVMTSTSTHQRVDYRGRWMLFKTLDPLPRSQVRW